MKKINNKRKVNRWAGGKRKMQEVSEKYNNDSYRERHVVGRTSSHRCLWGIWGRFLSRISDWLPCFCLKWKMCGFRWKAENGINIMKKTWDRSMKSFIVILSGMLTKKLCKPEICMQLVLAGDDGRLLSFLCGNALRHPLCVWRQTSIIWRFCMNCLSRYIRILKNCRVDGAELKYEE